MTYRVLVTAGFRGGRRAGAFVVAAAACAGTLVGCSSSSNHHKTSDATEVSVSVSSCGKGWTGGKAGDQQFVLHNTDIRSGEVDLIDARSGAVFAEVEPLGPGTTTGLHASLGAGHYAFRCFMEDEPAVSGATVALHGSAKGQSPAVAAVSQADLIGPAKAYEKYVEGQLPTLTRLAQTLQHDLASGDLARARRDWLPAHLEYQRLGAAYDAFGDVDGDINGLAEGLGGGVHDADWHGFHRIEYGLWHGQSARELRPFGDQLVSDIGGIRTAFAKAQVDPLDIGLRAHEITEDAVGFALTGRDDYGSHSGLATVVADIQGTQRVLDVVRSLLAPRYRAISQVDHDLAAASAYLSAQRGPNGDWPALASLDRATRERINSMISELAEELAPVATILEPRRTS